MDHERRDGFRGKCVLHQPWRGVQTRPQWQRDPRGGYRCPGALARTEVPLPALRSIRLCCSPAAWPRTRPGISTSLTRAITAYGVCRRTALSLPSRAPEWRDFRATVVPAASAQLKGPVGVAVDGAGNLYIADSFNLRVRKVAASGIITTIAGTGSYSSRQASGGPAAITQMFYSGCRRCALCRANVCCAELQRQSRPQGIEWNHQHAGRDGRGRLFG